MAVTDVNIQHILWLFHNLELHMCFYYETHAQEVFLACERARPLPCRVHASTSISAVERKLRIADQVTHVWRV